MKARPEARNAAVIWHDLECGAYSADLAVWQALADEHGDPVLDVGAGTGRVALELARHGHHVVALDCDPLLVAELERRVDDLPLTAVTADARDFALPERFPLIIVPMQTIQLLGGARGRRRFLDLARRHLRASGLLAIAISETPERYSAGDGFSLPLPDMREIDGVVYSSQPTAVREEPDGFILERLRETINHDGERATERDAILLDRLNPAELEREAREAGLRPVGMISIPATDDHVGSVVVTLGG